MIVETVTTVSFRYYARKSKADLVRRVEELETAAGLEPRTSRQVLEAWTRDDLARHAMRMHQRLPE